MECPLPKKKLLHLSTQLILHGFGLGGVKKIKFFSYNYFNGSNLIFERLKKYKKCLLIFFTLPKLNPSCTTHPLGSLSGESIG